jgi:hypothetical protein
MATVNSAFFGGGLVEFRLDAVDGPLIGSMVVEGGLTDLTAKSINTPIQATEGKHDLYTVFKSSTGGGDKPVCAVLSYAFKIDDLQ